MKNPDLLWEYQCLEQKKAQVNRLLKTMAEIAELRKLKEQIEQSQEVIRGLNQEKEAVKKSIKSSELEILTLREKLNKAELELYGGNVQATREIAAAEKNISVIKEKIKEEEDIELVKLEEMEQYENRLDPLLAELQEKKSLFRKINQDYTGKKEEFLKEAEEILRRQDALSLIIDQDDWKEYNELCEKYPDKSGIGILKEGVCSGCHMTISFEQLKKAKNLTGIVCDNCGRWLVVK